MSDESADKNRRPTLVCLGMDDTATDCARLNEFSEFCHTFVHSSALSNSSAHGSVDAQQPLPPYPVMTSGGAFPDLSDVELVAVSGKSIMDHKSLMKYAHIECNFKALHRGFDDLVEKLVKGYPNVRVIMIDPFWLQDSYYSASYGLNWISDKPMGKIPYAFKHLPTLECVIIPVGTRTLAQKNETLLMLESPAGREGLKTLEAMGVTHELASHEWGERFHPLVKATELAVPWLKANSWSDTDIRNNYEGMLKNHLHSETPHLVFYRQKNSQGYTLRLAAAPSTSAASSSSPALSSSASSSGSPTTSPTFAAPPPASSPVDGGSASPNAVDPANPTPSNAPSSGQVTDDVDVVEALPFEPIGSSAAAAFPPVASSIGGAAVANNIFRTRVRKSGYAASALAVSRSKGSVRQHSAGAAAPGAAGAGACAGPAATDFRSELGAVRYNATTRKWTWEIRIADEAIGGHAETREAAERAYLLTRQYVVSVLDIDCDADAGAAAGHEALSSACASSSADGSASASGSMSAPLPSTASASSASSAAGRQTPAPTRAGAIAVVAPLAITANASSDSSAAVQFAVHINTGYTAAGITASAWDEQEGYGGSAAASMAPRRLLGGASSSSSAFRRITTTSAVNAQAAVAVSQVLTLSCAASAAGGGIGDVGSPSGRRGSARPPDAQLVSTPRVSPRLDDEQLSAGHGDVSPHAAAYTADDGGNVASPPSSAKRARVTGAAVARAFHSLVVGTTVDFDAASEAASASTAASSSGASSSASSSSSSSSASTSSAAASIPSAAPSPLPSVAAARGTKRGHAASSSASAASLAPGGGSPASTAAAASAAGMNVPLIKVHGCTAVADAKESGLPIPPGVVHKFKVGDTLVRKGWAGEGKVVELLYFSVGGPHYGLFYNKENVDVMAEHECEIAPSEVATKTGYGTRTAVAQARAGSSG